MLHTSLIPQEVTESPEPELLHINDLSDKTAVSVAAHELRRDKFHRRIAAAADYLVKQERGHLRYGGQYATGATLWLDADGVGEIVRPEEITLWIV